MYPDFSVNVYANHTKNYCPNEPSGIEMYYKCRPKLFRIEKL